VRSIGNEFTKPVKGPVQETDDINDRIAMLTLNGVGRSLTLSERVGARMEFATSEIHTTWTATKRRRVRILVNRPRMYLYLTATAAPGLVMIEMIANWKDLLPDVGETIARLREEGHAIVTMSRVGVKTRQLSARTVRKYLKPVKGMRWAYGESAEEWLPL
jgi:hypothetical protein